MAGRRHVAGPGAVLRRGPVRARATPTGQGPSSGAVPVPCAPGPGPGSALRGRPADLGVIAACSAAAADRSWGVPSEEKALEWWCEFFGYFNCASMPTEDALVYGVASVTGGILLVIALMNWILD